MNLKVSNMNFVKNWNANAPFPVGTKRMKSAIVYPRRGGPAKNVPRTTNHSLSKQVDQTNLNKKLFFHFFICLSELIYYN